MDRIKGELVRLGFTYKDIASLLNISVNTLNNKLNGKKEFTLWEIQELAHLGVDYHYFFSK